VPKPLFKEQISTGRMSREPFYDEMRCLKNALKTEWFSALLM
jgi:hypothetical protein